MCGVGRLNPTESLQNIKGFKFGILYAQEGQTKEDEMFSNSTQILRVCDIYRLQCPQAQNSKSSWTL